MTDNGKHPLSNDPELLERFVLEKLQPGEREELEDHLRTCEVCRKAVLADRRIAAGVRRLGRDEFKERLTRRLAGESHAAIPWRTLAAAAVIIGLIGVGITSRWFALHEPPPPSPELGQVRAPAEGKGQRAEAARESAAPPAVLKKEPTGAADAGAAKGKIENAPAVSIPQSGNMDKELAVADEARTLEKTTMDEKKTYATGLSAGSAAYWTEGTFIQQPVHEESRLKDALPQAARVEREVDASMRRSKMGASASEVPAAFSISQRPSADLPGTRQAIQKQIAADKVQTLVEQRDDGVHLTLYLDSLVDDTALRNSVVQRVGPDSAVVRIANQQIGYRLPSLQQQIPAQKIKK